MTGERQMKIARWIVALVLALGLTGSVRAADQPPGPEAFYGRYQGTGLAQDPNAMAFGFDQRDFDVEIGAAKGGFFITWTTVIQSPAGKAIKRKTSRVVFKPSGRPGLYIDVAAAAGIQDGVSWASISGNALTVRVLAILDDGTYQVQTYERSLTKDGLYLVFRDDSDGGVIR
ncbi:MAG: hypothetical protein JO255_22870, partial [Alphaproteobacteria bacterium]|nr:hypothetical protein [Alphaproteobacteria bacterium]